MDGEIRSMLFSAQDAAYRDFQCRLMPTVDRDRVIGVRIPQLREIAKQLKNEEEKTESFLRELPHRYYDENNLHGILISQMKDYERVAAELDRFLPFVDNWATCDIISPKVMKKHLPELTVKIRQWIASGDTYTVRFGTEMLMSFYLDEAFLPEYLELVAKIRSDEYYVNMMTAWFFATALAKQYESTVPYIENGRLDMWTHNQTIKKANESYRISDERKAYLKTLRRNGNDDRIQEK